jgi:hypothetical protein
MTYDATRERVVLFGGAQLLWEWDGSDWRVVPTSGGPSYGVITYDTVRRKLLCYDVFAATTWVLESVRWTQLFPQVSPPRSSSENVEMTFDESRGVAVLHNGPVSIIPGIGTWEWDGVAWHPGAGGEGYAWFRGMSYDSRRQAVVAIQPLSGFFEWTSSRWVQKESAFVGHTAAYDASLGEVIALSFLSNSELISWNGSRSRVIPTNPGPPSSWLLFAHDTKRGRTLLFDGFGSRDTWEFVAYAATYTTFGAGCTGTYGTPEIRQFSGALPLVGQPFSVEVTNLPPSGIAYMVAGLSKTNWFGLPLPLPLDVIGMLGCTAYTDHIRVFPIVSVGGRAVWTTLVWNDPGRTFYNQAFVLDPSANPFGLIVSNAGEGVIGY